MADKNQTNFQGFFNNNNKPDINSEIKRKNQGNLVVCGDSPRDCMGKGGSRRDAHSSKRRTGEKSAPWPEQLFLSLWCLLLRPETVLGYTAG